MARRRTVAVLALMLASSAQAFIYISMQRQPRSSEVGATRMQLDPVVSNMIIGAVSGSISNMAVFPLEYAKTRMQLAKGKTQKAKYRSLAASIANITEEDGVLGLWKGSVPVLLGGAPESAIQLAAHSYMVAVMVTVVGAPGTLENELPIVCQVLAGFVVGLSTLGATNPMEVLRLKSAGGDTRGVVDQIRELGLVGLFEGCAATLLRDLPFAMIYFPLYCRLKVAIGPIFASHSDTAVLLVSGFIAGAVASYFTTPFDIIKTRVQSQNSTRESTGKFRETEVSSRRIVTAFATQEDAPLCGVTVASVALDMVTNEGWGSLMCGSGVRVMKLAPNMAITLVLYETAQSLVQSSIAQ